LIYSLNENIFLHITTVRNFSDETAMTQVKASSGGFHYVWPLLFVLLILSVFYTFTLVLDAFFTQHPLQCFPSDDQRVVVFFTLRFCQQEEWL